MERLGRRNEAVEGACIGLTYKQGLQKGPAEMCIERAYRKNYRKDVQENYRKDVQG